MPRARKADPTAPDLGDLGKPEPVRFNCSLCGRGKCLYSRGRGINRQTCIVSKEIVE